MLNTGLSTTRGMNNEILAMASKPEANAMSDPLEEAWEIIEAYELISSIQTEFIARQRKTIAEQRKYIATLEGVAAERVVKLWN